jgi:hypothetical protein
MSLSLKFADLAAVTRAGEWWGHKLISILCGFLLTLAMLGEGVAPHALALVTVLASLVPGAVYVSIVNDVTDIAADAAAGKPNRMAARPPAARAAAILLSLAGGLVFAWIWRHQEALLACYAAAWLSFTLYSVPPIRLKCRGFAGVVADAAGAQLFPTLTAVLAAFAAAGAAPDPAWLVAASAWALAYGIRSNLSHQLGDRDADRRANAATFAAGRSPASTERLTALAVFPVEVAGLAAVLAMLGWLLPIVALGLYAFLAVRRDRLWGLRPVLAAARSSDPILMHEYYDVFLPLALLAGTAARNPADLVVAALLLVLFRSRFLHSLTDAYRLILKPSYRHGRRIAGKAARRLGLSRRANRR